MYYCGYFIMLQEITTTQRATNRWEQMYIGDGGTAVFGADIMETWQGRPELLGCYA